VESPAIRRKTMQAVKSKDTLPELRLRHFVYADGFRYRLHSRDLPGCPDLVFRRLKKVIFVHGCFWHSHNCARGARVPKSNTAYWTAKIARNRARDIAARKALQVAGWKVLIVWECELKNAMRVRKRLRRFLSHVSEGGHQ